MMHMTDHATAPYASPASPPGPTPEKNGWGLAALIIGIVALLGAFVPILNYATGLMALAGIALGVVALLVKDRRRGQGIAGIVINSVALLLSMVLAIVYTVAGVRMIGDFADQASGGGVGISRTVELTYEVVSDGDRADIRYSSYDEDDGTIDIEIEDNESLPFSASIDVPAQDGPALDSFVVIAHGAPGSTSVSCRIIFDGTVFDQETSTGPDAVVTCNGAGTA